MGLLQPGQSVKHYLVLDKIGQGGMGQVYKAEDRKLGRFVAIKFLPEDAAQNEKARSRLLQEARSASILSHPNIVTIYSIDDHEGQDFIVMEYVEGQTLRGVIERGGLPLPQLFELALQLADALSAAHGYGIIHRDIKSENILLTPSGRAKVLDFGLAKSVKPTIEKLGEEAPTRIDITRAGALIGTVPYMSPEQTRGEQLDAASDVFSLGCVLYEAATGRLPFTGASALAVMHDIAHLDPPPPSALRPEISVEFDLVVERALAKDKAQRYPSGSELAEALKILKGTSLSGERPPSVETPLAESAAEEQAAPVGRAPELKKLGELLQRTIEGMGRILFITGEPGIGKSALVGHFMRRTRQEHPNLIILRGRCVEQYGTGEAYLPFLDAIGTLLTGAGRERIIALLRTYAPTWCLQFPAAFVSSVAFEKAQEGSAGATKERMLREMGDMLAALAASSPVVLVLEDLHWADASSVDLLRHISGRVSDQHLLIIGTYRAGDVELNEHPIRMCKLEMEAHNLSEELELSSLTRRNIEVFLDSRFTPNDFPAEMAALIHDKTEGHPLFVTSLVQFLVERGDIAQTGNRWALVRPLAAMDMEAPENVRSMICKKLESLADDDRRALQYASVEGEEFLSTVVAELLGIDDLDLEERLAEVERNYRLIEKVGEEELPDGSLATRYRFSHALYQNVLYADLVSKRRMLLHRQAGAKLAAHYGPQSSRIAAQLAVHFERGRDYERAAEHHGHAGDNAANLYASSEAAEHYGRAISLIKKVPDQRGAAHLLALYQKRGKSNLALGRFTEAVEDYTEMLDEARRQGSLAQESAALNALSMTLFYSHRLDEITERADEILRAAERAQSDALRIEAMQVLALKHLGSGELAEAKRMLDDIIKSARSLDHKPVLLTGLAWRGILYFFQTEYREAEEMLLETQNLARELHDAFLLLESYFVLGMVRGNQGRMSEALSTFEEALEIARRYGDQFWSPRIPNCIGWIYRELLDFEQAVKYDRQGLEVGRKANVLEAQANSLINLGIDHRHTGETEQTALVFREVENIFRRDAWFRWRYNIRLQAGACEHHLSRGDLVKAEEHAERLLEIASQYGARKYVAVAHKLLAEVAMVRNDFKTAEAELDAALNELQSHPVPIVAWKVYAALGRLRAKMGDQEEARSAFACAAETVLEIASLVREERLRTIFLNAAPVQEVFEGAGQMVAA